MKSTKFFLAIIILFLILIKTTHAFRPIMTVEVITAAIDGNVTATGEVVISDTTIFDAKMIVIVSDTINISKLHVVLKKDQNAAALLQRTFLFDDFGTLGSGLTYDRNGYEVHLGLGQFPGLTSIYAEVVAESLQGQTSSPVPFVQ